MTTSASVPPGRITVLGNSASFMVVPERASRAEGSYGEWLERLLWASGIPAEVRNHGRWFEMIHEGADRWVKTLSASGADVLVVHYGMAECQSNVTPSWAVRHLTTWDQGLSGARHWYRVHVAPRAWRVLRGWQRFAAARDAGRTWRVTPKRVRGELRRLLHVCRGNGMLVLVMDVAPPNDKVRHFLPGIDGRRDAMNAALEAAVDEWGDANVRFVRASQVSETMGIDDASPDGLHFSPLAHRQVAGVLLEQIEPFLRDLLHRRAADVSGLDALTPR